MFPPDLRKRAMKWLKMHAQYDDSHPWEALEIICTLAGNNPSEQLQADLRMAICKSYEYMYLFLERCMVLERPQEAAAPSRERRFAVRA
jgi:pyrroloquinoline quinone (PQQ) biosynthesis protein C